MGRNEEFSKGHGWTPADQIPITGHVHLPPTQKAVQQIQEWDVARKVNEVGEGMERRERAVKVAKARNSPYAMGGQRVKLRQHLKNTHGAWPEDVEQPTEELARWHQSWHRDMASAKDEDHTHE